MAWINEEKKLEEMHKEIYQEIDFLKGRMNELESLVLQHLPANKNRGGVKK
ncbi:hypothetical protein IPdc08_00655 [archaeon]|nr:hypothetical protein IPdc08_00655 [archaeon]